MSAFTDFVNLELPKRISIDVPPSGNLESGKLLRTTGIGLGVELIDSADDANLTAVLANNTSGSVEVGDITVDQSVIVEYTIKRNNKIQKGTVEIHHDTLTAEHTHEFFVHTTGGELGVTFGSNISGNELQLTYAVTNDTYDAGMVYTLRKHDLVT